MSSPTTWRDAQRTDRPALERFTCTSEREKLPNGRRLPHPKPWEVEAQTGIRTRKPPGDTDDIYRIGENEDGTVVGVSAACTLADAGRPTYKLLVLAVAASVRGANGVIADACLDDVLARIEEHARERGLRTFLVLGQLDPRNVPSQNLCARHGFSNTGKLGEYEAWARLVAVE